MTKNIYASQPAEILEKRKHTEAEWSFLLRADIEGTPGQFVIVSLSKIGEIPISISGFRPHAVEVTVRNTGKVTSHICKLNTGDALHVRGPYGRGFPLEEFNDQHLLVIVGGSAIAAAKPLIEHVLSSRQGASEGLDVLAGFKSPRHVLFHDELIRWKKKCNVVLTVDNDEDYAWMGSTGFVVSFIKDVRHLGEATRVVLIGPPLMMINSVKELLRCGVQEKNIYLSFERHMKCGVGKCGHCRIRHQHVCVDGPVWSYQEAKDLID